MIDQDHLTRQTAGDIALQHELLTLFLTQIEDLETCLDVMDASRCDKVDPDLPSILHRMRGAAVAVGAGTFAAVLAEAEDGWRRTGKAGSTLETLRSATRGAHVELSRILARGQDGGLAKPRESR